MKKSIWSKSWYHIRILRTIYLPKSKSWWSLYGRVWGKKIDVWAMGGSRRHHTLFFDTSSSRIAFPVGGHQKIDNMVKLCIESGYDSCLQFKYDFWYFLAILSFFGSEKNMGDQRGQFYPRRKNISLNVQDILYMILLCTKNQHFIINNTLTLEVWNK